MRSPSEERLALDAMGTRFELIIAGADSARERWRSIGEAALELITDWHHRLNRFDHASDVTWLRTRPVGEPVTIDDDLFDLLASCERAWRDSAGAFDPATGRFASISLDDGARTITFGEPDVALDLGGIAKGFVLDLVREQLTSLGVTTAFMHGGTSAAIAIGAQSDGTPWLVRIGDDDDGPVVELTDASLGVSRNDDARQRAGHVIDPRTGGAGGGAPIAAVIGASACACDAWATALLVLPERPETMADELVSILPDAGGGWRVEGDDAGRVRFASKADSALAERV